MSLFDIANEIKASGFDATKDSANGQSKIPAGTYNVLLVSATFGVSKSGWEMLKYAFQIIDGEEVGKTEYPNFGILEEWNGKDIKWSAERSLKFFQKAVVLSGDELMRNDFEDGPSLQEALNRKAVGTFYILDIEDTESKGKTYRSYDINEAPQIDKTLPEISDEDLPF